MQELQNENLDFIIVVTKIDKASQKEVSKNMNLLKKELSILNFPEIFLTSSVKKR
jgi:GTP-binding protein EngB required for normal cell division